MAVETLTQEQHVLMGVDEIKPAMPPITLEALFLENFGVEERASLSPELRSFLRTAIIIDALDIPAGITQKKSLLVYSHWQSRGAFPNGLDRIVREDEDGLRMMVDAVLEDEELDYYLDQIDYLRGAVSRNAVGENLKREITARISQMREESNEDEVEDEFFRLHPEALEVLSLKQEGLSHLEIAERLGKMVTKIDDISRALVFFNKIKPPRSQEERVKESDEFLRSVLKLRDEDGLSVKEIANELGTNPRRVSEAVKFLLWIRLAKKKDRTQVLLKRYGTDLHVEMMIEFLNLSPINQTLNLRKSHVEFCARYDVEISYDKFLSMYHQVENRKVVPPTKLTSKERIRSLMVAEIARLRKVDPNAIIFVGEMCKRLGISEDVGQKVFDSIDNTGLSNTRKGREEGRARVINILGKLAEKNELANLQAVAIEAGVSPKLVYRVYHQMKGAMNLPEIRRQNPTPVVASIVFESM